MHEIEFDEVAYYNKQNGTDGRETFDALKSSKKVKNAKKLYAEMIENLGSFLEDRWEFILKLILALKSLEKNLNPQHRQIIFSSNRQLEFFGISSTRQLDFC